MTATDEKKRGPGRPRSEPTKTRTVYLPAALQDVPHCQRVTQIEDWMRRIKPEVLIKNAMARQADWFKKTGGYMPPKFRFYSGEVKSAGAEAANEKSAIHELAKENLREMKTTIRLRVSVDKQIEEFALLLDCKASDIIRFALDDAFPDGGREMLDFERDYDDDMFRWISR